MAKSRTIYKIKKGTKVSVTILPQGYKLGMMKWKDMKALLKRNPDIFLHLEYEAELCRPTRPRPL